MGPGVDLWLCARLDLRCSYQETADELGITIHTVRHYIRGVYRKLQVHSVADAVRRAVRERLV